MKTIIFTSNCYKLSDMPTITRGLYRGQYYYVVYKSTSIITSFINQRPVFNGGTKDNTFCVITTGQRKYARNGFTRKLHQQSMAKK